MYDRRYAQSSSRQWGRRSVRLFSPHYDPTVYQTNLLRQNASFSERYAVLYDVCLYSAGSADSQQKVRKLIDSLEVTQQHIVMLVEGRLEDFFKAVLGGLANKYLDAFLPGLQVTSLLSTLRIARDWPMKMRCDILETKTLSDDAPIVLLLSTGQNGKGHRSCHESGTHCRTDGQAR